MKLLHLIKTDKKFKLFLLWGVSSFAFLTTLFFVGLIFLEPFFLFSTISGSVFGTILIHWFKDRKTSSKKEMITIIFWMLSIFILAGTIASILKNIFF